MPGDPGALQRLPGVGPYTASAVAAIAFGRPVVAMDVNVRRVASRVVLGREPEERDGPRIAAAARDLLDRRDPATWNQAMMDLGREVCRPAPRCDVCPLEPWCRFRSAGRPGRSAVAPKQSPFEGSNRQVRGRIVAVLRESAVGGSLGPGRGDGVRSRSRRVGGHRTRPRRDRRAAWPLVPSSREPPAGAFEPRTRSGLPIRLAFRPPPDRRDELVTGDEARTSTTEETAADSLARELYWAAPPVSGSSPGSRSADGTSDLAIRWGELEATLRRDHASRPLPDDRDPPDGSPAEAEDQAAHLPVAPSADAPVRPDRRRPGAARTRDVPGARGGPPGDRRPHVGAPGAPVRSSPGRGGVGRGPNGVTGIADRRPRTRCSDSDRRLQSSKRCPDGSRRRAG